MNTPRRSLLLGLAALALAGCASKPDLSRIEDPDVDFRAYRTFAFVQAWAAEVVLTWVNQFGTATMLKLAPSSEMGRLLRTQ